MKYLSIILLVFTLNGCLYQATLKSSKNSYKIDETNFSMLMFEGLTTMDESFLSVKDSNMYVTDFVDLENLKNSSKLGHILAHETKVILTKRYGLKIHEIEFTKNLTIGANGTKALSRDVTKLKKSTIEDNSFVVVGNYVTTQEKLIVYIKLIDIESGKILDTAKVSTSMSKEISSLI